MSEHNTGTVAVTNGSAAVVGTGTLFSANVSPGDIFTKVDSGVSYTVGSVTDDTHLVLTGNYTGTTESGISYTISTSFTSPDSIPYPQPGDTQPATILARMAMKIQDLFTGIINGTKEITNGVGNFSSLSVTGSAIVPSIIRENFIIGGDLATDGTNPYQRGTSGAASHTSYMADRWMNTDIIAFGTEPTWAQTADGLTITSNEATTHAGYAYIRQKIEGFEVSRLFGLADYFVLQGKIKSSVTGKYYISVTSSSVDASYVFAVDIPVANVFVDVTEIIPVPAIGTYGTGNAAALYLNISRSNNDATLHTTIFNEWQAGNYTSGTDQADFHATNGATISINKFKIEPGAIQTPFWTPDAGEERRRCHRYFQVFGNADTGVAASATILRVGSSASVEMRDTPVLSLFDTSITANTPSLQTSTGSAISAFAVSRSGFAYTLDGFTGMAAGQGVVMRQDYGYADSEL